MENNIFDHFDDLEKTPVSLMQEITEKPAATAPETGNLSSLTDHTRVIPQTPFADPVQPQINNPLPGTMQPGQKLNAGNLITGDMAVGFLDMLLPVAIVLIIEKVASKKINKKFLQATAEEKKTIAPVLQNYLNSINFNVDNPFNALLITCAFIYGTKTIEILNMPPGVRPEPFEPVKQQTVKNNSSKYNVDGSPKKDGRGRPKGSKKKIYFP